MATQNYVLGRGRTYFGPFQANSNTVTTGEIELGNSPGIQLTVKPTTLEHYSSQEGTKEQDAMAVLQVDRTTQLTVDNVSPENLALFFMGSVSTAAIAATSAIKDVVLNVNRGLYYQIGQSAAPQGVRGIANVLVRVKLADPTADATAAAAAVTAAGAHTAYSSVTAAAGSMYYRLGTDYTFDADLGRLFIVQAGDIARGGSVTLEVTYDTLANKRRLVTSKKTPAEGQFRFISANPKGTQRDLFCPWARLTPSGNLDLIADTWQTLIFQLEILELPPELNTAAIYLDGRPAYVS